MFYAKVRKSDSMVVGITVISTDQAANFPSDADVSLIQISEAQYNTASSGLFHDGSDIPKFLWTGSAFQANPDTRPVVTFTPDNIKAEVGNVVTVDLAHSDLIDGLREFFLAGRPTRMTFVAGDVTVNIDTSVAGTFRVGSQQGFRVAVPLDVTIYSLTIGQ